MKRGFVVKPEVSRGGYLDAVLKGLNSRRHDHWALVPKRAAVLEPLLPAARMICGPATRRSRDGQACLRGQVTSIRLVRRVAFSGASSSARRCGRSFYSRSGS